MPCKCQRAERDTAQVPGIPISGTSMCGLALAFASFLRRIDTGTKAQASHGEWQ